MRSKIHPFTTLLNAVSLCALLICILVLLFPMQPVTVSANPSSEVPKAPQQLFSFSSEQLDTIRISQGQDSFCLVNHGSSFVMEDMETLPLSSENINALLDLLEAFPAGPHAVTDASPFRRIDLSFTSAEAQTLLLYKEENQILLNWQDHYYRFSPEIIEALLWSAEDFADPTILPKLQLGEGKLRLSGALQQQPLELSFYMEENSFFIQMTSPQPMEIEGEAVKSSIQSLSGLCAAEVVVVGPDAQDLDFFELSVPFCTIEGQIGGEILQLSASPVQPDGSVYLISSRQPLLYAIDKNQLPLLSVCLETLLEESLFTPNYKDTTTLTIFSSQEQYRFTKWDGQVLCGGLQINERDFYDFFRLSTTLIPKEAALLLPDNTEALLTLTFSYTNPEKSKDLISFYPYDEESVLLSINGFTDFLIDTELVDEIFISCAELLE